MVICAGTHALTENGRQENTNVRVGPLNMGYFVTLFQHHIILS